MPADVPVEGPAGRLSTAEDHAWERGENYWHVGFAALILLALALLALDSGVSANRRLLAAGCVLGLAAWYAFVGAKAMTRPSWRRRWVAAIGTIAIVIAGFAADPAVAVLLFIVYPQLFTYLEQLRYTVPAVAALTAGVAFVNAADAGWSLSGVLAAVGGGAVSLAFAVAFGVWITKIIEQSRDRANLIQQLQATREELAEAHRETGAAAERQRLALEIHDTLAQGFTSIVMLVQAAEAQIGRSEGQLRRHLAMIERAARENLDEARSLVAQLGPVPLQSAPLAEALTRLTQHFSDETGVTARLVVTGTPRHLDGSSEVVLLRVAQEALTNVKRHAQASKVDVELSYVDDSVAVRVRDNGRGFAPAEATGFGLRGIRARVEQVGGDVLVDTAPGRGTCVGSDAAMTVRLIIVDDHPVVRAGLRGMLSTDPTLDVVGEASTGEEALAQIAKLKPDVVLMDLRMPGMDGATATGRISREHPTVKVVVLTTYDSDTDILRAVEAGAAGYLLKDTPMEELAGALRAAARGETVLAPPVAARLVKRMRTPPAESLTPRELQVLAEVARGLTNADVGRALYIGETTVKTHLLRIFAKLGVDDRTAAVTVAMERGILPSPGR